MTASSNKAKEIFLAAADLKSPAEKQAYLDSACANDAALRLEVDEMLDHHAKLGSFLQSPAVGSVTTLDHPLPILPGTVIGPYKLLQKIGEGGMGVVFMAEQTVPVQRKVALKIIKPGMDSKQVIARFEAERQALAMMDHVNIARVIDGGTIGAEPEALATESRTVANASGSVGRPYFVMELINGIPITKYCDDNHLTPRERLELFVPVCHAVQHAHQKGIIHRDIKPSNVLVTLYDGKPVPKVIDFGVAKAIDQKLTDNTLFTNFGTMVGTLEYMSPEQAEMNNLGVDTRSDIYSLGVLLYELLTGSTPLTRKQLKEAANLEILRLIKEEEPQKPSTRLSESGEALASISAMRKTEPAKLSKLMRGELDWIVMKTLEKDRNRRYETANGLGVEVQRYLADEPVQACPPSGAYRIRKFVQRNKGPVLAAAVILILLVGGIISTGWGLVRAEQATDAERRAKEQSQNRLGQIEKSNEILASVFKDLDPKSETLDGKELRVQLGERLDEAVKQLEGEAVGDPVVVARLQLTLGESLSALGYTDKAIDLFTKARGTFNTHLGLEHPDTLRSMSKLAGGYRASRKLDLALQLSEEVLRLRKMKLGIKHIDTLKSMNSLATQYWFMKKFDLSIPLFEELLKLQVQHLPADHPDTLRTMANLGVNYSDVSRMKEAIPLHEEALKLRKEKLGPEHIDTLTSMNMLANTYQKDGKLKQAMPLLVDAFTLRKKKLGADHPDTLGSMNNLASGYRAAGKLDLALPLFEEALKLTRAKLGPDHPSTFNSLNNLIGGYLHAGKPDMALPLAEETLKLSQVKLGPDHLETLNSMNNLALGYVDTGKLDLALPLYEECLKLTRKRLGPDHVTTITRMNNLSSGYFVAGKQDLALALIEDVFKLMMAKRGSDHPETLATMNNLATAYGSAGKLDLALPLFEESLKLQKAKLPHDHPSTLRFMSNLAGAYMDAGKLDLAMPLFEETLKLRKAKLSPDHPDTLTSMANLATCYKYAKKLDMALPLSEETLKLRNTKLGPNHPDTLKSIRDLASIYTALGKHTETVNMLVPIETAVRKAFVHGNAWRVARLLMTLGQARVGLGEFTSAEANLIEAHSIFTQTRASKLRDTIECTQALFDLYTAWHAAVPGKGYDMKAAEWKTKLAAIPLPAQAASPEKTK